MSLIRANITMNKGWENIKGIKVFDNYVEIDPEQYFFVYENPQWKIVDWENVLVNWDNLDDDTNKTMEQKCLDFIKNESYSCSNPSVVLENAEKVYSLLFDKEKQNVNGLPYVSEEYLNILKEASILMSLNKVDNDGNLRNVGAAWFFPICAKKVFNLSDDDAKNLDELYHGGVFNEGRRIDSVKAHTALGGRLVHGCQGAPDLSGGCIVSYGTNIKNFHSNLDQLKTEWMESI